VLSARELIRKRFGSATGFDVTDRFGCFDNRRPMFTTIEINDVNPFAKSLKLGVSDIGYLSPIRCDAEKPKCDRPFIIFNTTDIKLMR